MTDHPAYPNQTYGPPPAERKGAGMAITALILGILALLLCWTVVGGILFGILALVLGPIASGRAKRGVASGRGMAITGAILGLVGLLISVAILVFFGWAWNSFGGANLQDCLEEAGSDTAAQEQCQREFQDDLENRFN